MRTALGAVALVLALACAPLAGGRELRSPRAWEAFFGAVRVRAPAGATYAALYAGNRRLSRRHVQRGRVSFRVGLPPGRYDLRVRFEDGSTVIRRDAHDASGCCREAPPEPFESESETLSSRGASRPSAAGSTAGPACSSRI